MLQHRTIEAPNLTGHTGAELLIVSLVEQTKTVENGGTTLWQAGSRRGNGQRARMIY